MKMSSEIMTVRSVLTPVHVSLELVLPHNHKDFNTIGPTFTFASFKRLQVDPKTGLPTKIPHEDAQHDNLEQRGPNEPAPEGNESEAVRQIADSTSRSLASEFR